jgi:hypothetical protein
LRSCRSGGGTRGCAGATTWRPIRRPIHWGTLLQIGLEERREELFERPLREFAEHMRRLAPEVDVRVLRPGESTDLDD